LLLRLGRGDGAAASGFRFGFGEGSAAHHLAEADRLGLASAVVRTVGTAFDLDTQEDWEALLGRGGWEGAEMPDPAAATAPCAMGKGERR
jgi:hypothetical protein